MKLSELTDEEIWLAIAEVGEAPSGLAKLQKILRLSAGLITEPGLEPQVRDRLDMMEQLRLRFDEYLAELKRRHPSTHGEAGSGE